MRSGGPILAEVGVEMRLHLLLIGKAEAAHLTLQRQVEELRDGHVITPI